MMSSSFTGSAQTAETATPVAVTAVAAVKISFFFNTLPPVLCPAPVGRGGPPGGF
ncbi:MAG: hypothetical protein Kow00114_34400 [Kiloniellaceae bacterium]